MINIVLKKSDKLKSGVSAFLDFPYDASLVEVVRSLPQRIWNKDTKQWEINVESVPMLLDKIGKKPVTITGDNKIYAPNLIKFESKPIDVNTLGVKSKPFQHQIDALQYGMSKPCMFLGDEPGLGKSLSSILISLAKKKEFGIKHTLIIVGVNNLKWNYYNEIKTHTDQVGHILGMRTRKNGDIYIGGSDEKMEDLKHPPKEYFWITNIETLRNKKIADKLSDMCSSGVIGNVVLDESHRCCNPVAEQTKGLLKLKPQHRIAMTGTPMMNKPLDLWTPLHWLGTENHNFFQFKKYYAKMGGYGGYEIVGYNHLEDLQEDLDSVMLRRKKMDVLNLPEKIITSEYVSMDEDQTRLYNQVHSEIMSDKLKIMASPNPLVMMLRLRQATSAPSILTEETISCAKLERLEEIVEERAANGFKCVIFSNWTSVTDLIIKKLKAYNPAVITGQIKEEDRPSQQEKLFKDDTCKVLVGTIAAMGTGLTLTAANTAIFVDEPWNFSLFEQASDRIHRIGTKGSVEIISLITKDTIDERIHTIIQEKKEMADFIVDSQEKEKLFNFLMS